MRKRKKKYNYEEYERLKIQVCLKKIRYADSNFGLKSCQGHFIQNSEHF